MKKLSLLLVLAAVLAALPGTALAQNTERVEAFVYGTTSFDGLIYQTSMVPSHIDSIYMIADVKNVITPRGTLLYYWPLTNRYEADWSLKNDLVEGKLEVLSQNQLMNSAVLDTYIVQFDEKDPNATLQLSTGPAAEQAWKKFQALQSEYRNKLFKYYEDYGIYREIVDELTAKATKENRNIPESEWPAVPKQVPPLSLYSSELARGFIVTLPAGEYQVRLRLPDGTLQKDSQKRLVVFSKIQDGISYKVVPRSRWTQPVNALDPAGVVYAPPSTRLYLTPYLEIQFDQYYYDHMLDPQSVTPPGSARTWITYQAITDTSLSIRQASGAASRLDLKAYAVQQTAGQGLGYEVLEFDPAKNSSASFWGFELNLDQNNPEFAIELLDQLGQPLPGSARIVRSLNTQRGVELYFLAALPLMVGIYMVFSRRRSARAIKVKEG